MRRAARYVVLSLLAACGSPPPDPTDAARADGFTAPDGSAGDAPAAPPDADRDAAPADAPPDAPPDAPAGASYDVSTRTLTSGGVERTFVAAVPAPARPMLPLVIALHGDGGSGAVMRASFAIEAAAAGGAVVLYPDAPGGTFPYYSYDGRASEAQFVRALIDDAVARYAVDRARVFLAGFSGGATMANALDCWLGAGVIRGVAINSGTLYPVMSDAMPPRADFGYTASGGVDCAMGLSAALFVWGAAETSGDTAIANGEGTRDNYRATLGCTDATTPGDPSPCVRYQGCARDVAWCAIPGMAHALWPSAPDAAWRFFSALR